MNNEINKGHEDILSNYPKWYISLYEPLNLHKTVKRYVVKTDDALKAMAEVAGLRDKEVDGWESLYLSTRMELLVAQQQLTEKDKEVEQWKGKAERLDRIINILDEEIIEAQEIIGKMDKEILRLEQQLAEKDAEIAELKKELFKANEDYDKDFEKIKKLELEIEQLKAALDLCNRFATEPKKPNI